MMKAPPAADLPPLPSWPWLALSFVVLTGLAGAVFFTIKHDLEANAPAAKARYEAAQQSRTNQTNQRK